MEQKESSAISKTATREVSKNNLVTVRKTCRLCGSYKLEELIDLGKTPLADLFVIDPKKKELYFPLTVALCKKCYLVQLIDDVNDDLLFGDNYAFYTGGSPSSLLYFKEYANTVLQKFPKQAKEFTLEIASNDGTLLQYFKERGCNILGIDPAKNVAEYANNHDIKTLAKFFNSSTAQEIQKTHGKAGIIIANNVLAHVTDPSSFIKAVKKILSEDGVFIFECQYFPYLLFNNQFDNIYHEHRSFFSLTPLNSTLNKSGLKIIDVEEHDTQGGSIRVYVTHAKNNIAINKIVKEKLSEEEKIGLLDIDTYKGFASRINYIKIKLINLLKSLKSQGKTIAGFGASAKSNTLLNYCEIDTKYLDYIVDKTPYKFGLYTPGTHIPVLGKEKTKPDYYLLLVWNYASGILQREETFRKNGGKFIIPIPTPHIV